MNENMIIHEWNSFSGRMESREVPDTKNMNKDEYSGAHEGRVGADRMALNLPIIPDELKGDMDEVSKLCEALKKEKLAAREACETYRKSLQKKQNEAETGDSRHPETDGVAFLI